MFPMSIHLHHPPPIHRMCANERSYLIRLIFFFFFFFFSSDIRMLPLAKQTNQYLREQLLHLTEQTSSLKLSTTDRIMREIYTQSLKTFIIEKRNLTELVNEMANYTNGAIMKKLIAIRNLVNISEQSYRRFAKTDEATRNETIEFMEVSCLLLVRLLLSHYLLLEIRLFEFETCEGGSHQYN